jgi:hypothetical protein
MAVVDVVVDVVVVVVESGGDCAGRVRKIVNVHDHD